MRASENSKIRFPVLKTYFKVIYKNLPAISIYVIIMLSIMIALTLTGGQSINTLGFSETKYPVAFFDYDNTPLTAGLKQSISKSADFVSIKDKSSDLSDALFYHSVRYIVRVPKGFTKNFLDGKNAKIDKTVGQDAGVGVNLDLLLNRYLDTAMMYQKSLPGISEEKLAADVADSLSKSTDVTIKNYSGESKKTDNAKGYFTYICYTIIAVIFIGVSSIMFVFSKDDLRKRCAASPMRETTMSIQLYCGHFVYMLAVCAVAVLISIILFGPGIVGPNFFILCLNLFCFALSCLSLSFLIGRLVKNTQTQHAIANLVSLGMSFASGVFVGQQYLSSSVLAAARFTPSYWYVKAVSEISALSQLTPSLLKPVFEYMGIELGFAVAFLLVSFAITRSKKTFA